PANWPPARSRPGRRHALLLATGELTWQMFCAMRDAHAFQRRGDKRLALACNHSAISQRQLDIFKDGEIPYQIEALKNETDFAVTNTRPIGERKIGNFVSLKRVAAVRRGIE